MLYDKRSQLTAFVLIGIVLVIVFGFLFFTATIVSKNRVQRQVDKAFEDLIQTTALKEYITQCVEQTSAEAITLIGLQGGKLYVHQGGLMNQGFKGYDYIPFNYNNKTYNVSYAIKNPATYDNITTYKVPEYPLPQTNLSNILRKRPWAVVDGLYQQALGWQGLPDLCDDQGPNKYLATLRYPGCDHELYNNQSTVQQQLAYYIANRTQYCVDFDSISTIKSTYNITEGNASAQVTLGDEDIIVKLVFPIHFEKKGYKPVIRLAEFSTVIDARLKKVYSYAYYLSKKDMRDIEFNTNTEYEDVNLGWDGQMIVRRYNKPCTNCVPEHYRHADIIQIIDNASNINGQKLVFQAALENRYPALDYIHTLGFYDIIAMENDTLHLEPYGIDPDEDNITYNYSGWKETWNDVFDKLCCDSVDCTSDPGACTLTNSLVRPYNWTGSQQYQNTQQNATYTITKNDLGLHYTKVLVCDDSGLCDWQDVSILVFDVPSAFLNGSNPYPDIPSTKGSVEDFYLLDATQSFAYISQVISYLYCDNDGPSPPLSNCLEHPIATYQLPPQPDIERIKTQQGFLSTQPDSGHELSVGYRTGFVTSTATLIVEVEQCLPHRNPTRAPYPYNTSDGFQADHNCCADDYTYESVDTNCYNYTVYGGNMSFDENKFRSTGLAPNPYNLIYTNMPLANIEDAKNDIYRRYFERDCSGQRGNVCDGNAIDTRENIEDCDDLELPGQTRRCAGPPTNYLLANSATTNSALQCTYYTGQTFESLYQSESTVCNENWECSASTYNDGGVYAAQATCSGTNSGCTTPANSQCADSDVLDGNGQGIACGASCDGPEDYYRVGTTCNYGCTSNCNYRTTSTVCQNSQNYCLSGNYCYYDVQCPPASGGAVQTGEYCPSPGTFNAASQTCYYGTQNCNSAGNCILNTQVCNTVATNITNTCYHLPVGVSNVCDGASGCTVITSTMPTSCSLGSRVYSGASSDGFECNTNGWSCARVPSSYVSCYDTSLGGPCT
ncbi:hypothetical protein GOV04_02310 [Candidatus Woesearchaeota archaeon]|nr:hypothetical protein [Candidatus Woesearchaeota archaeon]